MNETVRAVGRAVRAGLKAASEAPSSRKFQAGGKGVVCTQCGSDRFHHYGAGGWSYSGYGLECANCSHIEYFGKRPKGAKDGA